MVSIIIPCYNRAHLLEETLNSIIYQSYEKWECIIIDDGSSDDTLEKLKYFSKIDSRFKYYSRPKSILKGATACRNYGYKLSQGDYICWFDSDDIMPVNSLKDRIEVFNSIDYDFVLGNVINFKNESKQVIYENEQLIPLNIQNSAAEYLLGNFWFQTSAPIFKKVFLKKFKKHFDESLTFNDETEFFIRILLDNPTFKIINSIVTLRRMHDNSLRSGVLSMPLADRILFNHFAYFKIWLSFKRNHIFYDDSIHHYFKYYFKYWIFKMRFNFLRLLLIYFYGIRHSMFDNNLGITKILLWRLFNNK
jgi:glycosyltransferase involved in cell wall biosynthesis